MTGLTELDEILRTLSPSVRAGAFVYVVTDLPLPSHASVVEREGGSLVVEQAVADEAGLDYESTFAWITLQVRSSLQAVGLTGHGVLRVGGEGRAVQHAGRLPP